MRYKKLYAWKKFDEEEKSKEKKNASGWTMKPKIER